MLDLFKHTKLLALAFFSLMVGVLIIPLLGGVSALPSGWNEKRISADVAPTMDSIAVDGNGKVHMLLVDYNYGIHLVYIDDASGSWSTPLTIDQCAGTQTDMAVDSAGNCHILYLQQNFSIMYATNAGGSWSNRTIFTDPYGMAFSFTIAVDHNDKVHIAFSTSYSAVVRYVTNAGGSWTTENVTADGKKEISPSIAVDSNNKAHVACVTYDTSYGVVYHERTTGTWTNEYVTNITTDIDFVNMCLDKNNRAHIAFMAGLTATNTVRYGTNVGGTWQNTTVATIPVTNGNYQSRPQIAVDSNDAPSICYCNVTSDWDTYIELASKSGSVWSSVRLNTGLAPSMAISSSDDFYVVYHYAGTTLDSTADITGGSTSDTAPGEVKTLKATAGDNEVTLTWGLPTSGGTPTSILVYRSTEDSQPSSPLATLGPTVTEYQDASAANNNTYYYWVVATNGVGAGPAAHTGAVTLDHSSSSSGNNTGLLLIIVLIVILVIIVLLYLRRKKKKQ